MRSNVFGKSVFLNGKFLPAKEAGIWRVAPGFLYGWGCFESMRSYAGRIAYFEEHLERIKNSCKRLELHFPYSVSRLKKHVEDTVRINAYKDSYVRLTLWKGSGKTTEALIFVKKYYPPCAQKYQKGFSCMFSGPTVNENNFLCRFKTTNRLFYELIYSQAKKNGFDEAIIMNSREYLAEGTRSNIFFAKNSCLFTPALECGCLEGITRKAVFDLAKRYAIKICEGNFTAPDLLSADEVFLSNSLAGLMPVSKIDKFKVGNGIFKLTRFLAKHYSALLIHETFI